MNLYLRLLVTGLRYLFEKPISTQDPCTQWFHVWPNDIDLYGHMNNGRYLQIMDVARLRWMLLTGTVAVIRRTGWKVALGGNMTRYRRPLRVFARYCVVSRLVCWDDRWFFLEHTFFDSKGHYLALGLSRAAFRGSGRWLSSEKVMALVEPGVTSEEMPAYIREWLEIEDALLDYTESVEG